jgi:flagellar protein FliS
MSVRTASQYQELAVTTAEPVKLVVLLYEGAVRFILRAKQSIAEADTESAHNNILRAYAIVAELQATLNIAEGGDIALNLERCYEYVLHLLTEANMAKTPGQLDLALQVIEPLLEAWRRNASGCDPTAANSAATSAAAALASRGSLDLTG